MTQEDEKLLLKDLSARLPYGVIVAYKSRESEGRISLGYGNIRYVAELGRGWWEDCKPYLRPMSSMTEEEKRELQSFYPGCFGGQWLDTEKGTIDIFECSSTITLYLNDSERIIDWLNKKMFDYRGLIERGLALVAPKGTYKI